MLLDHPKSVDFPDIVHQSEQPPLYIYFPYGTQSEAVHALVDTDVGKDRLDNAKPSGVDTLPQFTIDLRLHLIDQVGRLGINWHGKIPARSRWLAQTARLHRTGSAVLWAGVVHIISSITVDLVARMAGQFFSLRTTIPLFVRIEREGSCSKETCLGIGSLPAVEAILETFLIGKTRIAFSEVDVGDVGIDLFIPAHSQAVERMIVAVRGQWLALKIGFIFSDGGDVFFAPSNIGSRFS
jgi:hypothetical protein